MDISPYIFLGQIICTWIKLQNIIKVDTISGHRNGAHKTNPILKSRK